MEREERPSWIVRQENGAIAEARTRAILADRFWTLERSIDIAGADFIIQRRLTTRSLLDREAPRLGFIQAKFYQDQATTQYVHREYVLDRDGRPRTEFFLLCHTGIEDSARAFFLTAADIQGGFALTPDSHSRPHRFEISGRMVLTTAYEILHRGRVLQQIDQALFNADFVANRRFMSWALPSICEPPPIREEFVEKIDNWYGDIPPEFDKLRKRATTVLWRLSEACDLVHAIASTNDPLVAIDRVEDLHSEFGRAVSIDDIYDTYGFDSIVRFHHERYEQMKSAGLLGAHAALRHAFKKRVSEDVEAWLPVGTDSTYVVELRYEPTTFVVLGFDSSLESADSIVPTRVMGGTLDPWPWGIFEHKGGYIRAGVLLTVAECRRGLCAKSPISDIDRIAEYLTSEVMTQILASRFDSDGGTQRTSTQPTLRP